MTFTVVYGYGMPVYAVYGYGMPVYAVYAVYAVSGLRDTIVLKKDGESPNFRCMDVTKPIQQ